MKLTFPFFPLKRICYIYHSTEGQQQEINIFNCPTQPVTADAQPGATFTSVTWQEPTATDSFNQPVTNVFSTRQPGSFFPVGQTTEVTYTFTANSGARATCTFSVIVNGKTV